MSKENEKKSVTGLDEATNRKAAEFDLTKALLEASEYAEPEKNDDAVVEYTIRRNGRDLFPVRVRPISEEEYRMAEKKATHPRKNRNGRNLPAENEPDEADFRSWVIYIATVPEDQNNIWNNPAIKSKYNLMMPYQSVDKILTFGEKSALFNNILSISGFGDDGESGVVNMSHEEFAKN